jgi:hypothetical protein
MIDEYPFATGTYIKDVRYQTVNRSCKDMDLATRDNHLRKKAKYFASDAVNL